MPKTAKTETKTPWLLIEEAAEYLRQSPHTLRAWRRDGHGPKCSKPSGGRLLYHVNDLDAWITANAKRSSARNTTVGAA